MNEFTKYMLSDIHHGWNVECSKCPARSSTEDSDQYNAFIYFIHRLGWTCDDNGAICQGCKKD